MRGFLISYPLNCSPPFVGDETTEYRVRSEVVNERNKREDIEGGGHVVRLKSGSWFFLNEVTVIS